MDLERMFFLYTRAGHVVRRHSASMEGTNWSVLYWYSELSHAVLECSLRLIPRKLYICLAHPVCSVYRQSCCYKQELLL